MRTLVITMQCKYLALLLILQQITSLSPWGREGGWGLWRKEEAK
jgi:hypothetical protein